MSKYIYYNKKRKLIGLSLIETIVSMWILGIVIVSMLSFMGASMSKKNQLKMQAMSLAKSELQEAELDAMNRKIDVSTGTPYTRYTIILLKSSYQTKADENNGSDLKDDPAELGDGFYTKYVSDDGKNWTTIDSTNLDITSSNKDGAQSNGPNAKHKEIPFFEDSTPVSNSIAPRGISSEDLDINRYLNVKNIFDNSPETTKDCLGLENITIDKSITETYGYGIKCFVMKTTFENKDHSLTSNTTTTTENVITTTPITVDIIWSSEKKQDGYHPINSYELETEVTIIGKPHN